jgi:ferric-dicitrate binding protein FerR (iron transport regulator)
MNLHDTPALIRDYERTRRLEERQQERQDRADLARAADRIRMRKAQEKAAQRLALAVLIGGLLFVLWAWPQAVAGAHRYERALDDFRGQATTGPRP